MFEPLPILKGGVGVGGPDRPWLDTVSKPHPIEEGPQIAIAGGSGSEMGHMFRSPALRGKVLVQVGTGAGVYGTLTTNVAQDDHKPFHYDMADNNESNIYYANFPMHPMKSYPRFFRSGRTLLIRPTAPGAMGQTYVSGGVSQEERFYRTHMVGQAVSGARKNGWWDDEDTTLVDSLTKTVGTVGMWHTAAPAGNWRFWPYPSNLMVRPNNAFNSRRIEGPFEKLIALHDGVQIKPGATAKDIVANPAYKISKAGKGYTDEWWRNVAVNSVHFDASSQTDYE